MDVRIVSAHSNGLAYAGYIPGNHGRIVNEIRYWAGEDRLLCRNCGDIRHLALGSNYAFIYGLNIESEPDAAPALMQVSLDTGKAESLYVSGIAVGNYIVSDIGRQGKILCADGDALYFSATKEGTSQIYKLSASGEPLCLTLAPGSIEQLDVQAGRIAFAGLRKGSCQEVYVLEDGEQMISHLHGNDTLPFYPMVQIPCHGIQGWALREETEEKTCPAVIFLHDGPQQAFGEVYHFGMQLLAQNGYVVLFANLPGSTGYGKDFSMLDGHWGDDDYNGLIRFLDAALDACPEIDPSRLAVIGTGYGAYLAAVATGKCNRFGAAICDGVISNCVSMVSTSDHGIAFAEKQMKACAFKKTGELWKRSPLSRIASMKTPTLLLHGENDRSSHLSQGQMLFTALKIHGVPARLCVFPGENHSLASKGTPLARDRYHSEILRWLKMYL
ncbi:MAG: alpha/beta hydrolase family protein [Enterocloster bolteae]